MAWFMDLDRGHVRVGVAGKVLSAQSARDCLEKGADFVLIGRSAILHHDFPKLVQADAGFEPTSLPASADHLRKEGLGEPFLNYMRTWKGFVAETA
jgi:2,4-dienoyl-CoA reductase-like NADH-dependent reductase (Old Yellow Enzyme family)